MDSIFVFSGFIIITVAVLLYLNLFEDMKTVEEHLDRTTNYISVAYLIFLALFLTCYSFIGTSIIFGVNLNEINIIGALLFCVSISIIMCTIVKIRLVNSIRNSHRQTIRSLINIVEARDKSLKGHSLHVRAIGLLILDSLPKHKSKKISRQKFEYACLIHDLGKLGIPESILNKPASLTENEWLIMKEHPEIAIHIIKNICGLNEIGKWILYHHERMDGKGYYGLSGDEIPLASKIMTIADTYSALVMDRLYRDAREHEDAINIMSENSGTQFDPEVLNAFLKIDKTKISVFFHDKDLETESRFI
jgi:HD-GYP domain-containing protein (c-di-GMP phosphodiesterase class II)